jgi:hypothetical protein
MNTTVNKNNPNPTTIAQIDVSRAQDVFNGIVDTGKRMFKGTPPKPIKLDTSKARQAQNKESDAKLRDFVKNNPEYAKIYSQSHNGMFGDTFENKVKELMSDAPKMWAKYDSTMVLAYVGNFFELNKYNNYSEKESKTYAQSYAEAARLSRNVSEVHNGSTIMMVSPSKLRRVKLNTQEIKKYLKDSK